MRRLEPNNSDLNLSSTLESPSLFLVNAVWESGEAVDSVCWTQPVGSSCDAVMGMLLRRKSPIRTFRGRARIPARTAGDYRMEIVLFPRELMQ